jgi:hypothetical protein
LTRTGGSPQEPPPGTTCQPQSDSEAENELEVVRPMKRRILMALLSGLLVMGAVGSTFAKGGPPGPGNSHNGDCVGKDAKTLPQCQ